MLNLARAMVLAAALCIIVAGLLAGSLGIVTSFLEPATDSLMMITISVSFTAMGVGLGSILAWQAWQSMQGRASRPFRPRSVWVLGLLFLLLVLIGQLVLWLDLFAALILPPLHVAAAALPPLGILALAGYSLGGVTRWRDVVLQFSSGAFLSTSLAFTLEFVFLLGLVLVVLTVVVVQPGGMEQLQALVDRLQDPAWLQDPSALISGSGSPIVLVIALLVFAGVVPLIEEGIKTIGVGLMGYRHPSLAQAFLWGLAGGAGFAFAEGMFNSIAGLDIWAVSVSLRIGATLLHCFTGALMGLAWHAVLEYRQWGRALGLYAASVGIHSLWNALAGGMAFFSLNSLDSAASGSAQVLASLGIAVSLGILAGLTLIMAVGMVSLTRYVRMQSPESGTCQGQPPPPPSDALPSEETPLEPV